MPAMAISSRRATLVADNPLPGFMPGLLSPLRISCNRKDLDEAVSIHSVESSWRPRGRERLDDPGWRGDEQEGTDRRRRPGRSVLCVAPPPPRHSVEIRDAMEDPAACSTTAFPPIGCHAPI